MHRGVSSDVPNEQSLRETHTRLKEPDRRGNAAPRHRDYRIRIRFSTTSRCRLQGSLQQYQQAVAAPSRLVTNYEWVRNMKSGQTGLGMDGRWLSASVTTFSLRATASSR